MSDDRGIVVLGFPRSGTTLVRRLLDAHPRIACPPETGVLAAAARFLRAEPIDGGLAVGVESGLAMIGVDPAVVRDRVRALAVSFLAEHAASRGKPVWAEKHPYDVFWLERLHTLLGETVRWLVVVRDPLDVVVSVADLVARTGRVFDELTPYTRADPRPLCAYAAAWRDTTRAALALGAPVLRYEALVADPEAAFGAALTALGEPLAPGWLADALAHRPEVGLGDWSTWSRAGITADRVGRWKGLAPTAVADLWEIVGEVAVQAGYPPIATEARPEPADAVRRHQLAMHLQGMKRG